MDDSVEDGISRGGVALEHVVPVCHGQLRHDDGGFAPVPVLDDFQEVEQLLSVESLHAEVVDDEQVGGGQPVEGPQQRGLDAVDGHLLEELVEVVVGGVEAAEAGLVAQGRGQPALAGAGRAGDEDGKSFPDVVAGGECHHLGLFEPPFGVEAYLLDGGLVTETGFLEQPGVAVCGALFTLGLEHQFQAVMKGQAVHSPRFDEAVPARCHSWQAQALELH